MKKLETTFNKSLIKFYSKLLKLLLKNPSIVSFMRKTIKDQIDSSRTRNKWNEMGINVPPIVISSITSKCNLKCVGCYSNAKELNTENELSVDEYRNFLKQDQKLGIAINLLAGGEPFMRMDILNLAKEFDRMLFPVFTNGTLINEDVIDFLKNARNIIPILSIEGDKETTDSRRGNGIYDEVTDAMRKLNSEGIFFGVSATASSENFRQITSDPFIPNVMNWGAKVIFYEEFVPLKSGSDNLALNEVQREEFLQRVEEKTNEEKILSITLPGRDEKHGGCPAAGKGFVHLSPEGYLEPCPFAPFSIHNIRKTPLEEALNSGFFNHLRENHEKWVRKQGGCALWANREWVEKIRDNYTCQKPLYISESE
jgi:MoaA/NifB/PqqE/SkfB family radical SAM enzyme